MTTAPFFTHLSRASWIVFSAGFAAVALGSLGIRLSDEVSWVRFFDNLHWTAGTAAAAGLAWLGWARPGARPASGWFFAGFAGYAVGQLAWDAQTLLAYGGFPTPSDLFYLWLGPCLTAGLISDLRHSPGTVNRGSVLLDVLALVVASLTLVLVSYLPRQGDLDALSMAVLVAYPVTLVIPVCLLLVMIPALRLRITPVLLLFLPGLAVTAWSWMHWNSLALDGTAANGAWFNVSFSFAVLAAGLAAAGWRLETSGSPRWDRGCEGLLRMLPIVTILFACAAIIVVGATPGRSILVERLTYGGSVLVIILAILRQSRLLKERDLLVAAQAEVLKSAALVHSIVDTVPIRVFWKDRESRYLGCNALFARDAGFSRPEELIGKSDYDMGWSDQADLYRADDGKVIATGEAKLGYEEPQTTPDGRTIWLRTSKVPLRDVVTGEVAGVLGIYEDITERRANDLELERHRLHLQELVDERTAELSLAKDVAETANRAKSVFLSNMSHELRTPLNAILGFTQLMAHNPRIPREELDNIDTINRAGRHLLALINDVLEITRIEAGRTQFVRQSFDLPEELLAIEEMIRPRAAAKGLEFSVLSPAGLPRYVLGDAPHLRQVLLNLLGNAVKYTELGRVVLSVGYEAGQCRFEVADTGPGIAPDEQEKIFQAFYQTAAGIAKGEGTGLGLAISREYVRLLGGELGIESMPGQGSRFSFALPLPLASAAPAPEPAWVVGLAEGQASPRILVAEDQPDNRCFIEQLLAGLGCEARIVENGRLAVETFEDWRPQLVLMDMRMPVMDGYEATRRIRALPGGEALPIVALTASAFEEDRDGVMAAGCTELVRKPVTQARLSDVITRLLGVRFVYAEAGQPMVSRLASLGALPAEVRRDLVRAAEALDNDAVSAIIEPVRATYPEEVALVAGLAAEYRFDRIADMCR